MAQSYFTGAHLEFLEGRYLIFSKMRQICIKDKLQILQNTFYETQMCPKFFLILFLAEK